MPYRHNSFLLEDKGWLTEGMKGKLFSWPNRKPWKLFRASVFYFRTQFDIKDPR